MLFERSTVILLLCSLTLWVAPSEKDTLNGVREKRLWPGDRLQSTPWGNWDRLRASVIMKATAILLCSLFCFLFTSELPAAIGNDLFANRTTLTGTNVTVTGNNSGADTESGEDTGTGNVLWFYSVWYAWTAPTNGVVHLSGSTAVWNFYMTIRVCRGSAVNALTWAAVTPDGGVPVTTGDTIAIQVASIYYPLWSGGGGTGPFTLTLSLEVPAPTSANDAFANRVELATPAYHFDGGIYGATSEPGEPLPSGTSRTLWWKFIAPEAGVLTVWPSTPQFTPVMTLYEGASLGSLATVAPLNSYRYRLQAGHEYALQMATGYLPGGAFALDTRFFPLTNDCFAGSTHLEGTNITYVGNFTTATFETNEPNPGAMNTIWVSWTAPFTGRARFSGVSTPYFQYGALYTGPTLDHLQPVRTVGMDNGRCDFLAIEGTVYRFQFAGGGDECTLSLQLYPWGQATNDFFATARRASGQYVNQGLEQEWFSVADATAELGEPAHLGGTPFKSLWWKWTAPMHGDASFWAERSLATNVVLAAYKGNAVEALTLLAKGTNNVLFAVNGGDVYYIAAAVPPNALGDVLVYGWSSSQSSATRAVPGNLLQEPSWEGTAILGAQYWKTSGGIGGAVNESGGCDGTTWPTLPGGAQVWQDIPTAPGRDHSIRFAMRANSKYVGGGGGDGQVRVLWDGQEIGVGNLPAAELNFWHWAEFTAIANNPTSRVAFVNLARNVELDAFSVVPLTEPPQIVNQPSSASVIAGGTASFVVGASGSSPLTYSWSFNGSPLKVLTSPILLLESVTTNQAGTYQAVVSNLYGAVASVPVLLVVEAPTNPVILWQPYGDTVGVGGYYSFSVVAAGTLPLSYQWLKDNGEIVGATNRNLTFASVDFTNTGIYAIRVQNNAGIVWSLGAKLVVTNALYGGGKVNFGNQFFFGTNMDAPVFDIDGATGLNGSNYLAQLYGGPSLELLRPVGQPSPFRSGFGAGYFFPQIVTLPTVPPGSNAVLQVRAWEGNKSSSYEEARAMGGRFGKSELLTVAVGGGPIPPANLVGLQSFSLQAGLPQFACGQIFFVERQPGGVVVWSHRGEPGFRYVIERSVHGFEWRPHLVITNVLSTATFTDSTNSGSVVVFYRSRILD